MQEEKGGEEGKKEEGRYHNQRPDGVVEEDDGSSHKHGETDKFVKLEGALSLALGAGGGPRAGHDSSYHR